MRYKVTKNELFDRENVSFSEHVEEALQNYPLSGVEGAWFAEVENGQQYVNLEGVQNVRLAGPVFAKLDIPDRAGENWGQFIVGVDAMATRDDEWGSPSIHGFVLDVIGSETLVRRKVNAGERLIVSMVDCDKAVLLEDTHGELKAAYDHWDELYKNSTHKVSGQLYSDVPVYADYDKRKEFPHFEPIPGTEQSWDLANETLRDGSPIRSTDDAYKWLIENHPAYLQGCGVSSTNLPTADFILTAVPGCYYPDGLFENYEARQLYAQDEANRYGVEVGPWETPEDVLRQKREGRPLPEMPSDDKQEQAEYQVN